MPDLEAIPYVPPPSKKTGRVTSKLMMYYQDGETEEPFIGDFSFESVVNNKEQVYSRRLAVDFSPIRLDLGWLDRTPIGQVVIYNPPPRYAYNPTEEVRKADLAKTVKVSLGGSQWLLVPVGQYNLLSPEDPSLCSLVSLNGPVTVNLYLFPK